MLADRAGRNIVSEAANMLKLISFLCFLAVALATSRKTVPRLDGRIVGGSSTTIDKHPHQISLQYSGSHICGGSIISSMWVLTAAHCMNYSSSGYTVRYGTSTRGSGGQVQGVASVSKHSSFNSRTYDYDIAVIRISGVFPYSNTTKWLPLAGSVPNSGASAVVTGWGTTTEGGSPASTLQVVTVPIVSNTACNSYYGSGSITARMVCAGYTAGGRDACQGDGGSPLVVGGGAGGNRVLGIRLRPPKLPWRLHQCGQPAQLDLLQFWGLIDLL